MIVKIPLGISSLIGFCCLLFALSITTTGCEKDPVANEDPYLVTGTVTDPGGQLLEGVVVNSIVDTFITGSDGRYEIATIPQGVIEFNKVGYSKWIESVRNRQVVDVSLVKLTGNTTTVFSVKKVPQSCTNGLAVNVTTVEILDFGEGVGTTTFTNDKVWVLKNRVFVNEGQTLTIQPGTIVKGGAGIAETGSALIVARGGRLVAAGTPEKPIIFTSEADQILNDSAGNLCRPSQLDRDDKGLWGGVVMLGKARINTESGEARVGGIPATEPRGLYGGTDDEDNSGVLAYASIRHGGSEINIADNINGLTLAGVGRGTEIHHVEVYANRHDGFHFEGGTVNTKHLVASFCSDDAFGFYNGYRGMNQFWFSKQGIDGGLSCYSQSGSYKGSDAVYTSPVLFNATIEGPGTDIGKRALGFKSNGGGKIHNSIFFDFAFGAELEYTGQNMVDCYERLIVKDLELQRNIFFNILYQPLLGMFNASPLANSDAGVTQARNFVEEYFARPENANQFGNPQLGNYVPLPGGPASQQGSIPEDPFIDFTTFRGCFEPGQTPWATGWTRLWEDF